MIDRLSTITAFLARSGFGEARREPLAGDASARRYERLRQPDGSTAILTDTPYPDDDLAPFIAIGDLLARLGFSVPAILAAETEAGLAIQEDFGDGTLSRRLAAGDDPAALYALATDVLIELHRRLRGTDAMIPGLPLFDAKLFTEQVMLFADTHVPAALGRPLDAPERAALEAAWRDAIEPACAGPASLILRDYHVDNVILLPRDGVRAAGLIDYQNAGPGPLAYDLVSLLEDARRDVPVDLAEAMQERYLSAFPDLDAEAFRRSYAVLGAVRHTRIVGVFTRMALKEKRRGYLAHLPRVWRLLESQLKRPELAPVAGWFDRHLPKGARADFIVPEAD